ncbi:MAG: mu-like prophage DNA circulation protein [Nitrospirae bacterium]|nr:MAG: mu-like prophage DNA circulation protein [Nitrospirota bacterium]
MELLTINEIEKSLAEARSYIQEAIDASRGIDSLKKMAAALLDHANNIKLEREKIIKVEEDVPIPLHLVCLKHGLPYNDAERILAINSIKNPNFVSGEISIYAR